jgi:predicted enzyme related to lactoylglutathione lyase
MDHTIVHFEIPADDPERAARFYRELFGWTVQKWGGAGESGGSQAGGPPEYWLVSTVPTDEKGMATRAGVNGGLMRKQHPGHTTVHYISVENVDEYARKAENLGGDVEVAKMPVPGMGWFVWLKDPEGNVFGIWQNDEKAG